MHVQNHALREVPSSLKEELAKLASQHMPSGVLLHWYQLVKGQGNPPHWLRNQVDSREHDGSAIETTKPAHVTKSLGPHIPMGIDEEMRAGAAQTEPLYPCPWCTIVLKLPKDFIRHVKQKCSATEVFHCPDCAKTFTRKQRFAKHHNNVHSLRCCTGPCKHIKRATVTLPQERTLGCGFCKQLFHSDLHGYVRHPIWHYREGLTLDCWQSGPFVPVHSENMGPPQIKLDAENDLQPSSDFTALRSGFGLTCNFDWFESDLAASRSPTIYDNDYPRMAPAEENADKPYWQLDVALPSLAPGQQRSETGQSSSTTPTTAFFHGMGHHINEHSNIATRNTYMLSTQPSSSWPRKHPFDDEACAELIAECEHSNIFDRDEYVLPCLDAIMSLPESKDHRRTLSKRILDALQSLPVLGSEQITTERRYL